MYKHLRQIISEKIIFPFSAYIVKRFLRKKGFHEFMLRKEGQQWLNFLRETSDPMGKFFSLILDDAEYAPKDVFTHIYQKNAWQSSESRSGTGSSLTETEQVRKLLPRLLKKYEIKTLVDVPCGDWNWMKMVDLPKVGVEHYIGGDIVQEIVEENKKNYGDARREFVVLDLMESPLPQGDLLFCRDCLVHLPYKGIEKVLQNLHQSGIRYLLTTTFTNRASNDDIKTGYWRPLNLELSPFCFPSPLEIIVENCTECQGEYADKSLGLWEVTSLPRSLKN